MVMHLAHAFAELRISRPGSPECQRIVSDVQELTKTLEALRSATSSTPIDEYESLTNDGIIERLETLLKRAYENRDLRDHIARVHDAEGAERIDGDVRIAGPMAEVSASAPTRICQYCKRPQTACDTLRKEKPDIGAVICSSHPDAVEA